MRTVKELKDFLSNFDDTDMLCTFDEPEHNINPALTPLPSHQSGLLLFNQKRQDIGFFSDFKNDTDWYYSANFACPMSTPLKGED